MKKYRVFEMFNKECKTDCKIIDLLICGDINSHRYYFVYKEIYLLYIKNIDDLLYLIEGQYNIKLICNAKIQFNIQSLDLHFLECSKNNLVKNLCKFNTLGKLTDYDKGILKKYRII